MYFMWGLLLVRERLSLYRLNVQRFPVARGRTIFVADAHRDDEKPFVVRADEKLTAFRELESAIRGESHFTNGTTLDLTFANPDRERSYFDADLFKQLRESWVRTQVQTSKVAVFPDPRYASVFVLQALLKTSKGFVMIA
jgi:hypothetical protein